MGIIFALILAICYGYGCHSARVTIKNNCRYQIWPAAITGVGAPIPTGFQLAPQASTNINVTPRWSGRFWARSHCSNNGDRLSCLTGDCNSGQIPCNGAGGMPPATLVEFTIGGDGGKDFYDISLVDGFNIPVSVSGNGCPTASCPVDINHSACPNELAVRDPSGGVIECKSACVAFNQPQYCCTGAYGNPNTCKPTNYSQIFKKQCPQAYSYAYDDKTSLLTCSTGANYLITFCP